MKMAKAKSFQYLWPWSQTCAQANRRAPRKQGRLAECCWKTGCLPVSLCKHSPRRSMKHFSRCPSLWLPSTLPSFLQTLCSPDYFWFSLVGARDNRRFTLSLWSKEMQGWV